MKALDRRKFVRDFRWLCEQNGYRLTVESKKRGSHQSLIVEDPKSGSAITLVITAHRDISPGVQREALKYLGALGARVAIGEAIREILLQLFRPD